MSRTLLMSGFDVLEVEVPDEARILLPPVALPGLEAVADVAHHAMEEPLGGEPLANLVSRSSRICIVVDDFTLPVPRMRADCRRELLSALAQLLAQASVRADRVTVLVANGLARKWRDAELFEHLGPCPYEVRCHDAEDAAGLHAIGELSEGPVEVNRLVLDADLLIHLNVVSLPGLAGLAGMVGGITGARTARWLAAPKRLDDANAIKARLAALLSSKVRTVSLSVVLNNELWPPAVASLLRTEEGLGRGLRVWNALPYAVQQRAARLMKANYRPIVVLFGAPEVVAARAAEVFARQHEVTVRGQADVLLFGLPDVGPFAQHANQNPLLAAHLALGHVSNLYSTAPILRRGGVLIFANPLSTGFDERVHAPHEEFYSRVLRLERDPQVIHERFEPYFAARPEFVTGYQRRFAHHGTHPLHLWYACARARNHAGRVIVAGGDPRSTARLGLMRASDVEDALRRARELLGLDRPSLTVLELPPPFVVRVR